MPIHLNLLAEQREEEDAQRRDPVRQALLVSGVIIALAIIWSVSLHLKVWLANEEIRGQETRWQRISTNYAETLVIKKQAEDAQLKLAALYQLATNRFLLGPALSALQFAMVDNVQVTQLRFTDTLTPETQSRTVGSKTIKTTTITEQKLLALEGQVSGSELVQQAEKFKLSIAQNPYFKGVLMPTNGVNLKNYANRLNPLEPGKENLGVFTIECLFPAITH